MRLYYAVTLLAAALAVLTAGAAAQGTRCWGSLLKKDFPYCQVRLSHGFEQFINALYSCENSRQRHRQPRQKFLSVNLIDDAE